MHFEPARQQCTQESADAATHLGDPTVEGFLHLPMPKNDAENELYIGLSYEAFWTDITRVGNTDEWEYPDGTSPSFFDWGGGEPNDPVGEHNIEIVGELSNGHWNDVNQNNDRTVVCTYTLPAGAEETCPWLRNFEN